MLQTTNTTVINNARRNNREILISILRMLYDEKECTITKIIYKINLSHRKAIAALYDLEKEDLIQQTTKDKKKLFLLTLKGVQTVNAYLNYKQGVPDILQ